MPPPKNFKQCVKCGILPPPKQPVWGAGNTTTNGLMFVGQNPGREEDDQGVPFCNDQGAGNVLNSLLFNAGIPRHTLYITNIVKCRTPNNRMPMESEASNCLPYLLHEIDTLKPRMIVAMGELARDVLTNTGVEYRGSIVKCSLPQQEHIPVLITFHPAYLMRAREQYSVVLHDLSKIKQPPQMFKKEYLTNPDVYTFQNMVKHWKGQVVAIDIETAAPEGGGGLNPFTDNIVGIALCGAPGEAMAFTFPLSASIQHELRKFLSNPKIPKMFHNGRFDITFLTLHGYHVNGVEWDTQNAMYVINSDSEKSLDFLRSLYTNVPPYKRIYKTRQGVSHLTQEQLLHYNCLDVDVTKQSELQQKHYMDVTQLALMERLKVLDEIAIKMRIRGIMIDKNAVAKHYLELEPVLSKIENEFFKDYAVEITSPAQVSDFLYNKRKIPIPAKAWKSQTGEARKRPSVDEKILEMLKTKTSSTEDIEIIDRILSHRERARALSTYTVGLFRLIQNDGRVHPDWNTTGTDTGRWSCNNPGMQTIPEDLRDPYIASQHRILFRGDYSQLELLVAAYEAEEKEIIDAVLRGESIHKSVQEDMAKVFPADYMQAKQVVFGTIYGAHAKTLAGRFHVMTLVVEKWQMICMKRFPKLVSYRQRNIDEYEKKGYLQTRFGRRKYCENVAQALNFKPQSIAVDVALNALIKLEEDGWDPILQVHDENVCDCSPERDIKQFEDIMSNSTPQLGYFPVKAKTSPCWEK